MCALEGLCCQTFALCFSWLPVPEEIIGILNNLSTPWAHYHKSSLDVWRRSTVIVQFSGCDFMTASVLCASALMRVCARAGLFWLPRGWLMGSICKQNVFLSVKLVKCRQHENVRLWHTQMWEYASSLGRKMSAPLKASTLRTLQCSAPRHSAVGTSASNEPVTVTT